ncbi:MAG: hypothetical protein HKN37_16690 [Rhodothermales bacterium]|nr:hypothetical protein [Rhodothermales bacterium]
MKTQIPWLRVVVEGLVIVASILFAFGIDAGWDAREERGRRAVLMEDLQAELVRNAGDLSVALAEQELRALRIGILLNELTPQAKGLSADSVRALQASLAGVVSYDPSLGVLDLLIQSGDLALLEDRELRARLAGLASVSEDYLRNQVFLVQSYLNPEAILGTGSILFDYSDVISFDGTLTTASSSVQLNATKFYAFDRFMTELMVTQGKALLAEFEDLIGLMEPG